MGCDIHTIIQVHQGNDWKTTHLDVFSGRNYDLFGILAGVRSHNFTQIADTKGVPQDLAILPVDECGGVYIQLDGTEQDESEGKYNEGEDSYWLGDHSHSFLTAREIIGYDWEQEVESEEEDEQGVVYTDKQPLADYVGFRYTLDLITQLAAQHGSGNVRLVFGFDS